MEAIRNLFRKHAALLFAAAIVFGMIALTSGILSIIKASQPKPDTRTTAEREAAENWDPDFNAIFAIPDWHVDQVCGVLVGGHWRYLIHFTDQMDEDFKNAWWMMHKFTFRTLSNGTAILDYKDTDGAIVSAPDTKNLVCKKQP